MVTVPGQKISEYTCALKICGENLKPAPIPEVAVVVSPDAQGNVTLNADDAELHGDQIKIEDHGGQPNIGFWARADESVSWQVKFDKPGKFQVSAAVAATHADSEFIVEVAGKQLTGKPPQTATWTEFRTSDLGQIEIQQAGEQTVKVRSRDAQSWKAINLRSVKFTRSK